MWRMMHGLMVCGSCELKHINRRIIYNSFSATAVDFSRPGIELRAGRHTYGPSDVCTLGVLPLLDGRHLDLGGAQ